MRQPLQIDIRCKFASKVLAGLCFYQPIGGNMATVDKQGVVTMQELLVSSLATADALAKLLIEKGLITEAEFMQKLSAERAVYQEMLEKK